MKNSQFINIFKNVSVRTLSKIIFTLNQLKNNMGWFFHATKVEEVVKHSRNGLYFGGGYGTYSSGGGGFGAGGGAGGASQAAGWDKSSVSGNAGEVKIINYFLTSADVTNGIAVSVGGGGAGASASAVGANGTTTGGGAGTSVGGAGGYDYKSGVGGSSTGGGAGGFVGVWF